MSTAAGSVESSRPPRPRSQIPIVIAMRAVSVPPDATARASILVVRTASSALIAGTMASAVATTPAPRPAPIVYRSCMAPPLPSVVWADRRGRPHRLVTGVWGRGGRAGTRGHSGVSFRTTMKPPGYTPGGLGHRSSLAVDHRGFATPRSSRRLPHEDRRRRECSGSARRCREGRRRSACRGSPHGPRSDARRGRRRRRRCP